MPYLEDAADSNGESASKWRLALKASLARRIAPEQLKAPLEQLAREHRLPGIRIAETLLGFRAQDGSTDDPLLFRYAKLLLQASYMATADLLLALLPHFESEKSSSTTGMPTCEERMFRLLTELQMSGSLHDGPLRSQQTTLAVTRWLHTASEHESAKQLAGDILHTTDSFTFGKYEALAQLTISIFHQPSYRNVSKQAWWKKRRPVVVAEMLNFDLHVLQWIQSNFTGQLQALTKMPPFIEMDGKGRPILTQEQILSAIMQEGNVAPVQSRAGLYVWMSALFAGRPLTDDMAMLGYLSTRHSANNQALTVELVHAVFDHLTNSILRRKHAHELKCIRSFICNKVPLLLAILSSFMGQQNMETCIQNAFTTIAMDPIPPMETGSAEATDLLRKTRLEFLQACLLHGFVNENTIGSILQEPPITFPKVAKYSKEGLLVQCTNNVNRLEALAGELGGMQGNAGAVASCIIELVITLCNNKDTMSLKTACSILVKRIRDMDIVMQYTQPAAFLGPLCVLLKDWPHDQEQAEFTPAYEEFACVLLFTVSMLHRYGLTVADVGLAGTENFVFQVLEQASGGIPLADLTEEQNAQLSKWLEGLFAVDEHGETSGIGDEVMRQCPPQAFYTLVPTLFEQSVAAAKSGHLSMATLRSGIELLLEPFLLPSLIGGLNWLTSHCWEDHGDAEILLQILDKLLKPSTSSADTQAMHKAVVAVVAWPLKQSLQGLLQKQPDKAVVPGMLGLLNAYAESRRVDACGRAELDHWANVDASELNAYQQSAIRQMVSWASGITSSVPSYTYRSFLAACQLSGPTSVLSLMATELKDTPPPTLPIALDICTSLICAPSSAQQALRQELMLAVSDTQSLLDKPSGEAINLVRLNRSVEAQLSGQQMSLPFALPQVQADTADQMMQELGLAEAAAGPSAVDQNGNAAARITDADLEAALGQPLDLAAADAQDMSNVAAAGAMELDQTDDFFADLDMNMPPQQAQGQPLPVQGSEMGAGGQQNQEEDIFAGLDMGLDMNDDFNFG